MMLMGGAAAAWPFGTRAQQTAIPVIGWLRAGGPQLADDLVAFREGLNEFGYAEGRNVAVWPPSWFGVRWQQSLRRTLLRRLRLGLRPQQSPSYSRSVAIRSGMVSSPASAGLPATSRG
jgi:hypothetical protein